MSYTDSQTGGPLQTNTQDYLAIALSANVSLAWPLEGLSGQTYVSSMIDVTPTGNSFSVSMPDARRGSTGPIALFNNLSPSYLFTVKDSVGNVLISATPGTVWMLYLKDNSTAAGTWAAFQFGAQSASINLAAIAGSGLQVVGSALQQNLPVTTVSANFTISSSQRAQAFVYTGSGHTCTLPTAVAATNGWFVYVKNAGTGNLVLSPSGGALIAGAATKTLSSTAQAGCIIFCDGTAFYTITASGSGAGGSFDYTTVNAAGTGDLTLAGAQLNRISYLLTGVLTGNRNIIVPNTVQQYWVNNQTTGAFTLTVKTAAGTGQTITQGGQAIVYCDGTNVVAGQSGITLPVPVASGGTGATTASGARMNLGSTAVGDAVFTAASASAARAAIGSGTIGDSVFQASSVTTAVAALSGSQLTVNPNNQWNLAKASSGGTLTVNAVAGSPGFYVVSDTGDNGRMALVAAGVREWWMYAANADGSFHIADFTGSLDVFKIATGGQASAYEPSYSVTGLANITTHGANTFTGTLNGADTSPTATFYWRRNGSTVTVTCPAGLNATKASGSSITYISGIPPAIRAARLAMPTAQVILTGTTQVGVCDPYTNSTQLQVYDGTGNAAPLGPGLRGVPPGFSVTYDIE